MQNFALRRSRETQPQVQAFPWAVRARSADSTETSMNDNDEIAVTMWRALEKADTPEAGGIVLAKLVATWLGGYRPLDRAARWSEFQHTMRREMAARDRRFFGERVVPGVHTDDERAVPPATW